MNSISSLELKTKSGFVGQFEAECFVQQQNNVVRAQRMQQIRKQENELVKNKIHQQQLTQQKIYEEEQRNQKYQEYLKKKAEIETLEKARQSSILEQQKQQKEAEEYRLRQLEIQKEKQQMEIYQDEQAKKRFQQAYEWKKDTFLKTEQGKALLLSNQRKEASLIEKQKEAQSIALYKEQQKNKSQSTFFQDLENYEKFDKNVSRRQILKPEDFANTCFHNPQVVKHDYEMEKENAVEKANQTIVENQSMLLEQARMKREQERIQKQRSIQALSKERQAKVLEQLEQEAKFIKKQEIIQLQKTKPPVRKPKSEKNHQKMLSNEFDKMFNCTNSVIEVRDHRGKSSSPNQTKKNQKDKDKTRPKSVKIFTKPPLDTNLFSDTQKESMVKEDYTKYAMGGSEDQSASQKKRVQFSEEKQLKNSKVQEIYQDFNKNQKLDDQYENNSISSQSHSDQNDITSNDEQLDEYQNNDNNQEYDNEEITNNFQGQLQRPQSNQIEDLRKYIKDQEQYLQNLEQQRIDNKTKLMQGEKKLVQSFKNTRKQYSKQPIPEESEDESSYHQSPSFDNQQETDRVILESEQKNQQFQSSDKQSSQFETIDEQFNSQDLMQQFLQPKKVQNMIGNKQLSLFQDTTSQQQQKQPQSSQQKTSQYQTMQQFNSPNSDLNYSLSEVKNITSPIKKCEQLQQSCSPQQLESSLKKESVDSDQLKYSLQQSSEQLQDLVQQEYEETLGEIFQKRKAMLAKKMESRQDSKQQEKAGKTKEELIQIRKDMLKSKRQAEKEKQIKNEENSENNEEAELKSIEQQEDKRTQLMKRLAIGEKVKVDKKEMIGLTNKNYEQLPEVKKKKDELEKTESIKQRKQKVKEMDQKLREQMKQKRQQG